MTENLFFWSLMLMFQKQVHTEDIQDIYEDIQEIQECIKAVGTLI